MDLMKLLNASVVVAIVIASVLLGILSEVLINSGRLECRSDLFVIILGILMAINCIVAVTLVIFEVWKRRNT